MKENLVYIGSGNDLLPDGSKSLPEPILIDEVLRHTLHSNFKASAQAAILYNECKNYTFTIIATSSMGQWVKIMGTDYLIFLFMTRPNGEFAVCPRWP